MEVCCKNRNGIQVHTLNEQNRAHRFNERTTDFLVGDAPPSLSVKLPCILSYGGTVDLMTFLTLQQLSLHVDPHEVIQAFLLERVPTVELLFMLQTAQRGCTSFPAQPPAARGGVGGLAFAAKALPPTSNFEVCGWITSYLLLLKPPLPLHTGPSSSANLLKVVS